jgi:DNA (cytosine-5)-methyltransferase 1
LNTEHHASFRLVGGNLRGAHGVPSRLSLPFDPVSRIESGSVLALGVTDDPQRSPRSSLRREFRAAEFFAGIGLVRLSIEQAGGEVVFANDIEPSKEALYAANFGNADFRLDDVRNVRGDDIPDVDLATASFPCTDLSLAGNRRGLSGEQSGMFWEFARVLEEMGQRRPRCVLLENVPGFATSHGGDDLRAALAELNGLGYSCDLFVLNARRFVPQSRPRLFVVGVQDAKDGGDSWMISDVRPTSLHKFVQSSVGLDFTTVPIGVPPNYEHKLAEIIEPLEPHAADWWDQQRVGRFLDSLSPTQTQRMQAIRGGDEVAWRTAYRRTRNGRAVWEMRPDEISGCLRTARGGSSKQALVEAGGGLLRIRWMTPRECARLQGVPDSYRLDAVTPNQALFGLGDAVCVPAVAWVIRNAVKPYVSAAFGVVTVSASG